jgi:protein phosphatase
VTQPQSPHAAHTLGEPKDASSAARGEIRVRLFARTDVGQIREHNEDNFLVADLSKRSRGLLEANRTGVVGQHGSLYAVCDGMGGAAAGEIASQLAVDIVYERMIEGLAEGRGLSRDELARRLVRAIEAAGLRIFQEAKLDRTRRGMGTTVTAAALVDDHLFFAQVGDSRGYVLRGGQLVQLTRDQSLVNQLIEAGQLTEEEAESFEHNNIILQALGTADTVQVDLTYCDLRRGDMLLLCSDGLSGMVRFDEIREVLRTSSEPMEACKLLTERANQAGGHDNITVIIVQFDGDGLRAASPDEPLKYCKYALPEEPVDNTEPHRRLIPPEMPVPAVVTNQTRGPGSSAPQGLGSTIVYSGDAKASHPVLLEAPAPPPRVSNRPILSFEEEGIEIPGTHVPGWVVVALVVGVIVVLAATAFVLLR